MWQEPAAHPLLHLLASGLHGGENGRLGQYSPEVPIDDGPGAGLHAHTDDLCHGALLFGVQSIHGRQGAHSENRAGAPRPAHLLLPKNPGEPQADCAVDGEKRPARKLLGNVKREKSCIFVLSNTDAAKQKLYIK